MAIAKYAYKNVTGEIIMDKIIHKLAVLNKLSQHADLYLIVYQDRSGRLMDMNDLFFAEFSSLSELHSILDKYITLYVEACYQFDEDDEISYTLLTPDMTKEEWQNAINTSLKK